MKDIGRLLVIFVFVLSFLGGCGTNNDNQTLSNEPMQDVAEEVLLDEEEQEETATANDDVTNEGGIEAHHTSDAEPTKPLTIESKNEQEKTDQLIKETSDEEDKAAQAKSEAVKQVEDKSEKNQSDASTNNQSQPVVAPASKNETAQNSNNNHAVDKGETVNEITLSIKGDQEKGVILQATKVPFKPGDTVLDVLKNVTKQNRIHMEYTGRGMTAYIEGIDNLYEFDKGPKSGWMYSINGEFKRKGAGTTEVKAGDQIDWLYTLDLGNDLGENVNE